MLAPTNPIYLNSIYLSRIARYFEAIRGCYPFDIPKSECQFAKWRERWRV